jgi:HEPN domain-containing protein
MNDETRDAVKQWRAKADSDWTAVEILLSSDRCPAQIVCFHCQQYVEKLLKALLTAHGVEAPKTHDLRRLIQLAEPFAAALAGLSDRADLLTSHGVQARYPDDWREVPEKEMNDMVELAKEFRAVILPSLEE